MPERDNPHDRHAVAVHLGWTSQAGIDMWDMIGYVPAEASELVNMLLASGEWAIEAAFVKRFDASPELDAPRVVARLEGKDLREGTF